MCSLFGGGDNERDVSSNSGVIHEKISCLELASELVLKYLVK